MTTKLDDVRKEYLTFAREDVKRMRGIYGAILLFLCLIGYSFLTSARQEEAANKAKDQVTTIQGCKGWDKIQTFYDEGLTGIGVNGKRGDEYQDIEVYRRQVVGRHLAIVGVLLEHYDKTPSPKTAKGGERLKRLQGLQKTLKRYDRRLRHLWSAYQNRKDFDDLERGQLNDALAALTFPEEVKADSFRQGWQAVVTTAKDLRAAKEDIKQIVEPEDLAWLSPVQYMHYNSTAEELTLPAVFFTKHNDEQMLRPQEVNEIREILESDAVTKPSSAQPNAEKKFSNHFLRPGMTIERLRAEGETANGKISDARRGAAIPIPLIGIPMPIEDVAKLGAFLNAALLLYFGLLMHRVKATFAAYRETFTPPEETPDNRLLQIIATGIPFVPSRKPALWPAFILISPVLVSFLFLWWRDAVLPFHIPLLCYCAVFVVVFLSVALVLANNAGELERHAGELERLNP